MSIAETEKQITFLSKALLKLFLKCSSISYPFFPEKIKINTNNLQRAVNVEIPV